MLSKTFSKRAIFKHKFINDKFYLNAPFSTKGRKDEPKEKQTYRRTRKDLIEETYTEEELRKLHDGRVIKVCEIPEEKVKQIVSFRKLSFFVGLPLSLIIPVFNETYFSDLSEFDWRYGVIYHSIFFLETLLFGSSLIGIFGLRNIVVSVNYLTKEKKLEMVKIKLFGKRYKCALQEPDHLMRWKRNIFNPFLSIKNKKTQECFSFNLFGEVIDKKLYYTLLPTKKHKPKAGSLDDTML
jgi:hypothetical protein